ncbi:hypothetical protein SAMN04487911_10941 [Arenibacter nanhaiticus]|uniref:Uncharacterized protein n=1 Tax=Arenibacter nanhaiticus TaxID=558155 RepID=A0A1M6FPV4_9FLAO|nr:hypothetical protein [Arenibacter nanhaiticus]SHI99751.1 hypothetical protein SAMN04487911_10941 [Arenibacter nanhaiticus]
MTLEKTAILYEESVLPGFSEFRYLTRAGVDKASMEDFDYVSGSRASFNGFARRLRVAKSIESITFNDFGEGTSKGYEALNRHFLMFSAFERYVTDCEGIEGGMYHLALQKVPASMFKQIKDAFDIVDTNDAIFNFLLENCNSFAQRRSLKEFRKGEGARKGLYVSAMLRNCFAHGLLTAHPKDAPKGAIEMLCNFMSDFLYNALCYDFNHRLQEVRQNIT